MIHRLSILFLSCSILTATGFSKATLHDQNDPNRILTNGDRLTEILHQAWYNSAWTNSTRQIYTYPSDKKRIETQQMWDNGVWTNSIRLTVTYDDHMNMIEMITESQITGTWFQTIKNVFINTYDGNGNLTEVISQTEIFGTLSTSGKTTHTWDNGKLVQSIDQRWDNGAWVNDVKTVITYNNGNKSETQLQLWENGAWVNSQKYTYTYSSGILNETLAQQWENGNYVNILKTIATYSGDKLAEELIQHWNNGAWEDTNKNIYTYGGATGVRDRDNAFPSMFNLTNFPNPFNPRTTIVFNLDKSAEVVLIIYDTNGRRVKSLLNRQTYSPGSHAVIWDGTDHDNRPVPSGVYFYRIQAGTFSQTKRCTLIK